MEKFIVTKGKTIELAISAALEQLKLDRDSVSVEVLKNAKAGQEITLKTGYGDYKYKIRETAVRDSLDTTAYDLSADYENLVLYTCYPFDEVGLTDKRLFVYADFTDGIPIEKN